MKFDTQLYIRSKHHMCAVFYSILLLLFVGCASETERNSSILQYVPQDAVAIFAFSDLQKAQSDLKNNTLIKNNSKNDLVRYFEAVTFPEETVLEKEAYKSILCVSPVGKTDFEYTFVMPLRSAIRLKDSLSNKKSVKTLTYENKSILAFDLKNEAKLYATYFDSTVVASSSQLLIENTIRQQGAGKHSIPEKLTSLYGSLPSEATVSVLVRKDGLRIVQESLLPRLNFSAYRKQQDWMALDFVVDQNSVSWDGIGLATDSIPSFPGIFNNTYPQEHAVTTIVPATIEGLVSYTYDDYEVLQKNLATYHDTETPASDPSLNPILESGSEVAWIQLTNKEAFAITGLDVDTTLETVLDGIAAQISTYRNTPIYAFTDETSTDVLTPLVPKTPLKNFCILNDVFVFGESTDVLQTFIANYQNKTLLGTQPSFLELTDKLSDQSSILVLGKVPYFFEQIAEKTNESYSGSWKKTEAHRHDWIATQFIKEPDFVHIHGVTLRTSAERTLNEVRQIASTTIDNNILMTPHLVRNHRTKGMDIVVQDVKNQLYLISAKGNILWKKQLNEPILGEVQQLDIYRNGRLQLVFATPSAIHLIDRNGKDVAPYPIKTKSPVTQPLALFDYDKNKKYRLLVTHKDKLAMYDAKGKPVSGFKYASDNKEITQSPEHLRISGKDYIVFSKNDGTVTIVGRTGKPRVTVKQKVKPSSTSWYAYRGNFVTTNANGNLISITPKGTVKTEPTGFGKNHGLAATTKTLVTFSENKLRIKGKNVELPYGTYTAPEIFYIQNKIYVTITDLEAHQVYAFDSKGEKIANFPVYGNSKLSIGQMDNDANLECTVKGEENTILIYEIN